MRTSEVKKVLIVDDEPDICFLFSRILKKRNLDPGFASNLAEAAQSVQADPPALVFLDNSLPDGQGMDFISYLKNNFPHTRIVMVTANDSAVDKKKALQYGADDFIGKPVSLDLINRTLDQL